MQNAHFEIPGWQVDVDALRLRGTDRDVTLEPRIMALLHFFCRHPGVTLSKELLLDEVWGSEHFTDSTVTRAISILRGNLGDAREDSIYIQTVPRRGYRFIASVRTMESTESNREVGRRSGPAFRWLAIAAVGVALAGFLAWNVAGDPPTEPGESVQPVALDSIAVLPFDYEGAAAEAALPLAGLHIDVSAQLARLSTPRVYLLAAQDSFDAALGASAAAGADALLTARAFDSDGRLAIELRLLGVASRELVWSSEYAVDPEQAFETRQQMVRDLASLTRTGLSRWEQRAQQDRVDPEAYGSYLEALWFWRERSFESLARGQERFEQAVAIDPDFADAQAGLALSFIARVTYGREDRNRGYAAAAAAAEKALALDPDNPWALTAEGQLAMQRDWQFERAVDLFQRAIAASPSGVDARQYLAEVYAITGRHADALRLIEEALVLRPNAALLRGIKGMIQTATGEYAGAIATLEALDRSRPRFNWHLWYWSFAEARLGNQTRAMELRLRRRSGSIPSEEMAAIEASVASDGGRAFWEWKIERLSDGGPPSTAINACLLAEALSATGRYDEAVAELQRCVSFRSEVFPMFRISPQFDPLRARADFQALLAAWKLPLSAVPEGPG